MRGLVGHCGGMSPRLATILTLADLSLAEMCSARLDGELFTIGDFWCPIDEVDDAEHRARALALLGSTRLIVERASAAWVYGDAPEPTVHQFCLNAHTRSRLGDSVRVVIRQGHCRVERTQQISGMAVTLPLYTAVDLARSSTQPAELLLPVLRRLLNRAGTGALVRAHQDCHNPEGPTTELALARLTDAAGLTDQPSLTR